MTFDLNKFVEEKVKQFIDHTPLYSNFEVNSLRKILLDLGEKAMEAGRSSILEEPIQQTIDVALDALRFQIRKQIEKYRDLSTQPTEIQWHVLNKVLSLPSLQDKNQCPNCGDYDGRHYPTCGYGGPIDEASDLKP